MIGDHERIEELVAAQVLGGLDPGAERELAEARAEHGADCEGCARLERELTEVAGLLPFSLDPVAVDPAIVDRVLAEAQDGEGGGDAGPLPRAARDDLAAGRERRAGRGSRASSAMLGVAAVLVALVILATTVVRSPVEVTSANVAGQVVRFDATGDAGGTLAMAYTPGEPGAVFWGHGLADPGEGQTYEIWMIEDGAPTAGGCTTPVDGRIALFVDAEIGTTELMAVTVEPTACPPEPSTDPVLVAELTTA